MTLFIGLCKLSFLPPLIMGLHLRSRQHGVRVPCPLMAVCSLRLLYSSPNIVRVIKSRRLRWAGHVVHMGEEWGVYRVLLGKPEGKRALGRPRCRWVDNIRTELQEVGCGYMDWIGLAQDRDRWQTLVSAVMNLRVP